MATQKGPCWVSRMEDMTGTDDLADATGRMTPDQWAAVERIADARLDGKDCGWQGPPPPEDQDQGGCYAGYCWCRLFVLEALCSLEVGHAGPHEFEDTRDLVLGFAP
jgi:hypothetical protein